MNLREEARFEATSVFFMTGWCKAAWDEGLLLVDGSDVVKAGGPFFVPWANVAAIQIDSAENAPNRQKLAQETFVAIERESVEKPTTPSEGLLIRPSSFNS